MISVVLAAGLAVFVAAGAVLALKRRYVHRWAGAYVRQAVRSRDVSRDITTVVVCVADHFEPAWGRPGLEVERQRIAEWVGRYPTLAVRHSDAWGRPPQHTFFYPEEEYSPEHLSRLSELCRAGFGDVEVHMHHDRDSSAAMRDRLERFARTLHERHGLLRRGPEGKVEFGFIHGNWALDNSHPDGRHCGVNDELIVLRDSGCYADFTFPSAPHCTQPPKINSIYYATDDPVRPCSHHRGTDVRVGGVEDGDLMLVQGPLAIEWVPEGRILPRIENGELSGDAPPSPRRADLWVRQRIGVRGRPDWVFVKLHTHGAQEKNYEALLGAPMDETLSYLEHSYNDGVLYRLMYATARELYELVKAAESGRLDAHVAESHGLSEG